MTDQRHNSRSDLYVTTVARPDPPATTQLMELLTEHGRTPERVGPTSVRLGEAVYDTASNALLARDTFNGSAVTMTMSPNTSAFHIAHMMMASN